MDYFGKSYFTLQLREGDPLITFNDKFEQVYDDMMVICEECHWARRRLDSYVEYNCQMIGFSRLFSGT